MGNLFSADTATAQSPLASGLAPPKNNSLKKNMAAPPATVVTPAASPSFMNRVKGAIPSLPKVASATPAAPATTAAPVASSPSFLNRMKKRIPSLGTTTPKVGGRRLCGTRKQRKQRKSSRRQQRK